VDFRSRCGRSSGKHAVRRLYQRAGADEVAGRGHQCQRVERLENERLCAGRQRAVALIERRQREYRNTFGEVLAELHAATATDHEVDDRKIDALFPHEPLGVGDCPHDEYVVTLGAQEVLGDLRGIGVTLGEENGSFGGLVVLGDRGARLIREPVCQRPVGVGRAQSMLHLLADEPERFAQAVVMLLKDPKERLRFEGAAAATAARYDWPAIGERFSDVLARVAGNEMSAALPEAVPALGRGNS